MFHFENGPKPEKIAQRIFAINSTDSQSVRTPTSQNYPQIST